MVLLHVGVNHAHAAFPSTHRRVPHQNTFLFGIFIFSCSASVIPFIALTRIRASCMRKRSRMLPMYVLVNEFEQTKYRRNGENAVHFSFLFANVDWAIASLNFRCLFARNYDYNKMKMNGKEKSVCKTHGWMLYALVHLHFVKVQHNWHYEKC